MKLKDQVAVITGSGSGIGRSIAQTFAREGAQVVVIDINEANGLNVLAEVKNFSSNSMAMKSDVSKADEVRKCVDATLDKYKKIDILVNNAGTGSVHFLEDTPEEEWDRIMSIDLKGVFLFSQVVGTPATGD